METPPENPSSFRRRVHEIIFEADTPAGKAFDLALLLCIIFSIIVAMLESVTEYQIQFGNLLYTMEWIFTILFTIEYIIRMYCVGKPLRYAMSFYGIVDLLSIIPTYLSIFVAGTHSLIVIRAIRLLRVFRVLKLTQYIGEAAHLMMAIRASARKIVVFLGAVLTMVVIIGALMYLIEGGQGGGFTSIPQSMYWAIVTMTTVGYGDTAPITVPGKMLAAAVMIIGYGIIAVPTGIVTMEMGRAWKKPVSTQACPQCSKEDHDIDAVHCKFCGAKI